MSADRAAWRNDLRRHAPLAAFGVATVTAVVYWTVLAADQWFIRDDWAFLVTRPLVRELEGTSAWLFGPQDGHWMTVPILVQDVLRSWFGLDSYWPFLVPTMLLHLAAAVLVRVLARRIGVAPWTATVVASLVLLFGNGWENVVFAVQITYNLALVAFLAQLLLVDHDGPAGRRDAVAGALAVVGVMSSGLGPVLTAGTAAVLLVRRRWIATAVAVGPAALVYLWWLIAWADDPTGDQGRPTAGGVLRFARLGLTATLTSMTGQVILAGAAVLGLVGVATWTRPTLRVRTIVVVLTALPVVLLLGIGWQRAVFGIGSAASSRYQYVTAVLLAVPLALAVDQLRRYHRAALVAAYAVIGLSILGNVRYGVDAADDWAARSGAARRTYSLLAGSALTATVDQSLVPVPFDPDVPVGRLGILVRDGAIEPTPPVTDADQSLVRTVLGLPPP